MRLFSLDLVAPCTTQKNEFSIKEFFGKSYLPKEFPDLVTLSEKILNGKLLCSVTCGKLQLVI